MQDAGYIFAAYTIIWVVLFGFVLAMINRQAKVRREIDRLRELIKDKESPHQTS
jgi:CcmD family protein